jgi:hypothetical protein
MDQMELLSHIVFKVNTHLILLVYPLEYRKENWISDLKDKVKNNCQIILLANKCDLVER